MPVFNTSAEPAPTPWPAALVNRKEIPMHSQGELNRHGRNRYGRIVQRRSAVAALADVFVQSLVIAGSCPDHAPKQRTSPIHNRISSIGYRAFGTSTTYSFNTQNPNRSNFGLRSHSVNPCVSRIHSQPISTYAAKSDIDDRGPRHSDYFPPMRVDNKILTSTERNPERMILGYDDLRTIRQSKETVEIPPHNASTHRYQDRRTIITSTNWRDRKRPAERPFTFKYHEKWVTNHKGRVKAKRRRNNKDGPAVKQRLQEPTTASHLKLFLAALWDHTKSNQYIFSLYKRLPSPGVKILSVEERSELLYRFAHPPDRRRSNARYFLMLFKDMIDAGFKLSRSMCTSAIYFTSHKVPKLEKRDLMDAIAIWHRMETMYGIQSDNVVFELLFRIASLSGHFAVGDRLIQEMRNRGMRLSRRGHVSMLHSYGKRGDIEGLQKAFEEFVSLGEVVDTSVINCLISSLLNAGEFDKAQQIYSRMMQDHARTTETAMTERRNAAFYPSTSSDFAAWRSRAKGLSAAFETYLEMRKKQSRENGQQLYVPIMPDSRTFYIMFRFHCVHTGDLTAVSQLLNDMEKVFESPPRTIVYYFLFRGFAAHSSAKGWTEARLLEVWKAFKGVLYDSYTRMDRFEGLRLPLKRATWENPLKSLQASQQESHAYSEALVDGQNRESQMDYGKIKDNTVGRDQKHGDEDLMALFDQLTQYGRLHNNWIPDENMLRRLDNGMFLSRELNIVILKAFGAHCDIKALLRLYSDIERMWKPVKRLAVDVQSMRKELRRQLVRIYKREQEMTKHRL